MHSFWTTAELRGRGKSAREIHRAVSAGTMRQVRPGRYVTPGAPEPLVRAVRVGGLATAHTAARALGLWTPPDAKAAAFRRRTTAPPILRVAVPNTSGFARLRDPDEPARAFVPRADVALFWTAPEVLGAAGPTGHVDVLLMLEHLFRCETPERALAVLDSALHERHLRPADLPALATRLPTRLRTTVLAADGRAESGIETIVRYLLQLLGLRVEVQQRIGGVGIVDLLVEGRVIVECDGREWHDDDAAFENDRNRDLYAIADRYRTVRATWFQVLFRWPDVEAAVLAALAA